VTVGDVPALAVKAARTEFRMAGLLAKRVDEIRLAAPAVTVPDRIAGMGGAPGGATGGGWTVGRLLTHDGSVRLPASGDQPGVMFGFAVDLHEVGADPERAGRAHRMRLRDVRVRYAHHPTSVVLDEASAAFTVAGLLDRRQLLRFTIDRGTLVLDRMLRDRLSGEHHGAPVGAAGPPWTVAVLDVAELGIRLSDLGPQIPDLTLLVHTRLRNVPLGVQGLAAANTRQRLELAEIALDSPLDPFRPVVRVGSVFIEFSLAELLARRIASIDVLSPTIYLGEDLIWYMNSTRTGAATAPREQPWTVRTLRAELGRIVLTFRGVDRVGLPLTFRTDAHNVVLGDLAQLRLAAALEVPRQNYTFPGLDLALHDVEGELRFDYPPGTARDNVVNTLKVSEIRWRDYRIRDGWLAATFDEKGINAKLGGGAYAGYVNGGASVPFGPGAMSGWAAGTDLDLAPLTRTVAGSSFEMTGVVDVVGSVDVVGDRIDRAKAELDFKRAGQLSFPSLDRVLERLPPGAPSWQRDLAGIAVETFRDYPYDDGGGTFAFADARGEAHVGLKGERGKRSFDVHFYEDTPSVTGAAGQGE